MCGCHVYQQYSYHDDNIKKHPFWYCQANKRHEERKVVDFRWTGNKAYSNRGLKVQTIIGDGKFKHIQEIIKGKGKSMKW